MASKLRQNCIRDGSDTHLEAGSVVNKGCTMPADGDLHFIRLAEMCRFQRLVSFDEDVNHIQWNHSLTPGTRHIRIHDGNDGLGTFDGCQRRIDGSSQRYVAVLVGRTYLDHCYITRQSPTSVKLLCLAQEYRNVIRVACLNAFADIGSDKEGLMEEDSVKFRVSIGSRTFGVKMMDTYVFKFPALSSCTEGVYQYSWGACHAAQMDMVA